MADPVLVLAKDLDKLDKIKLKEILIELVKEDGNLEAKIREHINKLKEKSRAPAKPTKPAAKPATNVTSAATENGKAEITPRRPSASKEEPVKPAEVKPSSARPGSSKPSSASSKRVTVFMNGTTTPSHVILIQSSQDMSKVLEAAAAKLNVAKVIKFCKEDGNEVEKVADLEGKVYALLPGQKFVAPQAASPRDKAPKSTPRTSNPVNGSAARPASKPTQKPAPKAEEPKVGVKPAVKPVAKPVNAKNPSGTKTPSKEEPAKVNQPEEKAPVNTAVQDNPVPNTTQVEQINDIDVPQKIEEATTNESSASLETPARDVASHSEDKVEHPNSEPLFEEVKVEKSGAEVLSHEEIDALLEQKIQKKVNSLKEEPSQVTPASTDITSTDAHSNGSSIPIEEQEF